MKVTPSIAIIIPVLHEGILIRECLEHLARMKGSHSAEVIIVDGGAGSTIRYVSASHYPFSIVTCVTPPGRGLQLGRGAQLSAAPYLVFLHADTRLRRNAFEQITAILSRYPAGAFDLYVETTSYYIKTVAAFASVRSRLSRIPYGDQVQFLRREVYDQVGGYHALPVMEDVEFIGRLKHLGFRIRFTQSFAVNPDRRWRSEGAMRRTLKNWSMMLAYRLGVSAAKLSTHYRPQDSLK